MILIIECIIACILFTVIIETSVFKNPIKHIMSYPKAIRKRVESLPQYKESIDSIEKKHLSVKIISIFVFAILLAIIAYLSGAKTFSDVFKHGFTLFFVVNIYDMVVLDIGIFCHSKKLRIPGTEDMDKEYKNPKHHIVGAIYGTILGTIVALLSATIILVTNNIL